MPLLLLWHPQGEAAAPDASDGKLELSDVELWLIPPDTVIDSNAARVEPHAFDIKLVQGPLGQDMLTVKGSIMSPLCTTTYGGNTALSTRWAGWILALYVRQTLVFDGPIEAWDINWAGNRAPGMTYDNPGSDVTVTALSWTSALLRRRKVETSTGGKYSKTDTPNRILADLIRTNCVTGSVITPTDWQQGSETRDDFGNITVACAVPTAAGTSQTYKRDCGDNLLDAVLELCNAQTSDADWLWPVATRSGTTVTFTFLRGRSGGSRGIGTDRTTTASGMLGGGPISAERGNLVGYQDSGDRVTKGNHITGTGQGRGAGMRRSYHADTSDVSTYGVYEEWAPVASADDSDEIDVELKRLVNERKAGTRVQRFRIVEIPGECVWPAHFAIGDSVPIYTPLGESLTEVIMGVQWTLSGKGPPSLELDIGQWPALPERDLARSGGGGRGGRGGGGRPRSKSAESKQDPDSIFTFKTVTSQSGSGEADVVNDSLEISGYDTETYVRAYTRATDDPEVVTIQIIGDYTDAGDFSATGYLRIRDSGGTAYYIPCSDTNPFP